MLVSQPYNSDQAYQQLVRNLQWPVVIAFLGDQLGP